MHDIRGSDGKAVQKLEEAFRMRGKKEIVVQDNGVEHGAGINKLMERLEEDKEKRTTRQLTGLEVKWT